MEMQPYASRTGTKLNLDTLMRHGWRLLVEPSQIRKYKTWPPQWTDGTDASYMIDNGAWGCFQANKPFDGDAFLRLLDLCAEQSDMIVVPDIVCGGLQSLDLSLSWIDRLTQYKRPMVVPVQDGMTSEHLESVIGGNVGIFIGGSTDWKLQTAPVWARMAMDKNVLCHMGRVNTVKRIHLAISAGCTSIDGTSCSVYSKNCGRLSAALQQPNLFR